jgi:hypothetical protein
MLPARKDEVVHVEDGVKKDDGPIERRIEVRLLRLEDKVTVIATDLKELRSEFKGEMSGFRGEMNSLRTRMEDGFQSLRKAMEDGFQALRKEMTDSSQSVRKEVSDAKIWALILAAGMLGVIARGFHWI